MRLILLLCGMLLLTDAWAQTRTVSGTVTGADDGAPVPGANVILKGTNIGTSTDVNGNFTITVPAQGAVLVVSFIGFQTKEITLGDQTSINVVLSADINELAEVVVIGYGEQDKRTLTSSISSISGSDIALKPVQSFDQALAGKASGVQVVVGSGLVGQAPRIRIRGTNSISSGADPLIVIDGVPMLTGNVSLLTGVSNNLLGDINPSDIESFQVLKDGAATAIYGSRAANGVILITTKTGKSGKMKISYDYQYGANTIARKFDVLNAEEFIRISNEKFATGGITTPQALPGPNNDDTDWQDVIFRTGIMQNHNLNFSGANEESSYFFSAGYSKQEGAVVANSMERYTMRANLEYHGIKWLNTGLRFSASRQVNDGLNSGTNSLSGNVRNALYAFPNVPVFDPNHPTGYNISEPPANRSLGRGNNLQDIASNYTNIKYVLDKNINRADNYRLIANGHLQANILEGLNVKTQYGIDFTDGEDFQSLDPFHGDGGGSSQGIMNRVANRILRWNWQNTVNFKRTFADSHNLGVTIGNEYQLTSYRYFIASGTTFSDPFFLRNELIGGSFATQESGGDYAEEGFESLFGRLNYDFNGRYLFSFSVRNDGISSLPEANRKGTFLGASVGWVVSDEVFFNVSFIDQLKVRGSYAEVGNTAITSLVSPYVFFPYSGTYAPEIYGSQSGISFSNVGNASLKWETSKKLDIGIDLSMLNNRITLAADYFQNDISDMIMNAPTPPTAGLPGNSISKNVGSMINKGIELTIGTDNLVAGPLKWTTDVTFTYNVNEITALNDDEDMIFTYNINRVGHSIGSIYGYDYTGVNPANGNPLYRKGDGTIVQGNVTDNRYYLFNPEDPSDLSQQTTALSATLDRKILGNTAPKFFGGINNTWRWKNFDLELFLVYSGGNKVLNVTRQSMMAQEFVNNHKDILNRWTPENPNTDIPRLSLNNSAFLNLEGSASSRFVEDGDFLRVQNISLGYDLPKSLLNTVAGGAVRNLRIYTQVRNAFVFTKYRGGDPELNFSNVTNSQTGIDFSTNPLMRTFTVGLSIGL